MGTVLRSRISCPAIAAKICAQSSALRAIGPMWSMDGASAIPPYRLTRPYVGRSPLMPQNAEGQTIEPHVSVPIANPASPAATIAPEPDDDPQVQQLVSQGFLPAPCNEAEANRYPSPPASSIIAALPISTAPTRRRCSITAAS